MPKDIKLIGRCRLHKCVIHGRINNNRSHTIIIRKHGRLMAQERYDMLHSESFPLLTMYNKGTVFFRHLRVNVFEGFIVSRDMLSCERMCLAIRNWRFQKK